MWYNYLNREQAYLRSYRSHNLWLDQYQKTIRTPRAQAFHMQVFKRLAKSYSGNRVAIMIFGLSYFSVVKFGFGFSQVERPDLVGEEGYNRLVTIFSKNKFGYNTRFMSDFDIFLEALFNQRFINESTNYYEDPFTEKEISDVEAGLNSDFHESDIRHLLKDKGEHAHESFKATRHPDRVGTNYAKGDQLSCYK